MKRYGRLAGRDAARQAMPVYVCAMPSCETHHKSRKQPDKCLRCGGMAFEYFASTSEANRWAALRLQERLGHITKLRRQVRMPLMTMAPNGLLVRVADVIPDYVYFRDGEEVWEDNKPASGMDPLAKLKFKWFAAQYGKEVLITSN